MLNLLCPDVIERGNGGNTQAKNQQGGSHIVYVGPNPHAYADTQKPVCTRVSTKLLECSYAVLVVMTVKYNLPCAVTVSGVWVAMMC